jgi:hypothetical protein
MVDQWELWRQVGDYLTFLFRWESSNEIITRHLDKQNTITFTEGFECDAINKDQQTKPTKWFELNRIDSDARACTYVNMLKHYTWSTKTGWTKRKAECKMISILITVYQKDFERFCLKLLLMKTKGAQSYDDLKMSEGVTYDTFAGTVTKRGLINVDQEYSEILEDAATSILALFHLSHCFYHIYKCNDTISKG